MSISYNGVFGAKRHKTYCSKCGQRLIIREKKTTYKRGEPGFKNISNLAGIGPTFNVFSQTQIDHVYYCVVCNKEILCEDQDYIAFAQKKLGKIILSDEEMPLFVEEYKRRGRLKYWLFLGGTMFIAILIYLLRRHFQC